MTKSEEDATFIREDHDREHPFTVISRALPRDKSISPSCRLLIIFLLTHDNKWVIKTGPLMKEFKAYWGRDKFYIVLNEAIKAGYIIKQEYLVNNLTRYRYIVFETPQKEEIKKIFPNTDPQDAGISGSGKHGCIRNSKSSYSVEEKKKQSADAPCADEAFGQFVKLSKSDYEKFTGKYGKEFIDDLIESMNDHIASKGLKPYKDYAATIRNWIKRKQEQGSPKPKSVDLVQKNHDFAKSVKEKFSHVSRAKDEMELGPTYFELGIYPARETIEFKEKGFRERVVSKLRKMNYSIENL